MKNRVCALYRVSTDKQVDRNDKAENRDKLQIIKGLAKQKKFDILLVFMFDRIGRISWKP